MGSNKFFRNTLAGLMVMAMGCGPAMEMGQSDDALKASKTTTASYALHTTSTYTTGTPTWQTSFVINSTYNVYFAFDVPSTVTGSHTATVYIYAPGGSLYQKNVVSFAAGTTAASGEQQAQAISGGYRVWTSLPVAGTTIQQYSMSGGWSAQAFLDSASTANATAAFNLQ